MIVSDMRELADLHGALGRIAASRHPESAWAGSRLTSLQDGYSLTDADASRIRVIEAELYVSLASARAMPALTIAEEESHDSVVKARKQIRKTPSRYL